MGEKRKSMTFMGTGLAKKINECLIARCGLLRSVAGLLEWRPGWDPRWDPIEIQVPGLASTSKPKASAWCFEPLFFTPAVHLEPPAATNELQEEHAPARAGQERALLPNPMENQCFCGRPLSL